VLGPSEGGLGGQDAPDGFPASGRNAYPPGANAFFAHGGGRWVGEFCFCFMIWGISEQQVQVHLTCYASRVI